MSGVYQHFRREEKEFIDQVTGWRQYVEDTYADKLTDFLDPRQQFILSSIIGEQNNIRYELYGGTNSSERKRALLYPEYFQAQPTDYRISLLEIQYPTKFINLDHRMVLGSIMSLGLKRDKFGDIIINEDKIQLFVAEEIEDFVVHQLTQIGKAKVNVIKQELSQLISSSEKWKERETTASSLRLDVMIAAAFNISRQRSQLLIGQGHTKVNWEIVERPAFECGEGDVLSVRGLGRCSLLSIQGKTKKDKIRVKMGVLK